MLSPFVGCETIATLAHLDAVRRGHPLHHSNRSATLTLALAAGVSLLEATALANYAAGIEVGKLGVATVSSQELIDRLLED